MPLIKKARAASSKVSFYSAGQIRNCRKALQRPRKSEGGFSRDDFIFESVLCQCSTAKDTTGYADGFQPVKETADMTDGSSGGAHARRVRNQIGDLGLAAADVVQRCGALKRIVAGNTTRKSSCRSPAKC